MKKNLAVLALVLVLTIGMASIATAEEEETDAEVTVSEETAVDVKPDTLKYEDVGPGDQLTSSEQGFTAVEVENIGSEDIDTIFVESTTPSADPFGTGDSTAYDSGNFIQVNTADEDSDADIVSESEPHFATRVEYQELNQDAPSYIQADTDEAGVDTIEVGRFREGGDEFFYTVNYEDGTSQGECDGTGDGFVRIGQTEHTSTDLGTFDFTDDGTDYVEEVIEEGGDTDDYGTVTGIELEVDGQIREFDAAFNCNTVDEIIQSHSVRTRFDKDVATPDDAGDLADIGEIDGASQFLLDTDTESNMLRPGASFTLNTGIEAPLGVAEGSIDTGFMTVRADSPQ